MKKISIILLFLALSFSYLFSDGSEFKIPDFKKIEKEIKDKNSKFYYPKIFERYKNHDTTLTDEDFHYLYYGYTTEENYNPDFHHDSLDTFLELVSKEDIPNHDFKRIVNLSNIIIKSDPFNIRVLKWISYIYHIKGNDKSAFEIGFNNSGIINCILNSGDGASEKTSIYVNRISDEYEIMKFIGLKFKGQSLIQYKDQDIDVHNLENNEYNLKNFYFNVTRIFDTRIKNYQKWK
jgi:hypothetical protein